MNIIIQYYFNITIHPRDAIFWGKTITKALEKINKTVPVHLCGSQKPYVVSNIKKQQTCVFEFVCNSINHSISKNGLQLKSLHGKLPQNMASHQIHVVDTVNKSNDIHSHEISAERGL